MPQGEQGPQQARNQPHSVSCLHALHACPCALPHEVVKQRERVGPPGGEPTWRQLLTRPMDSLSHPRQHLPFSQPYVQWSPSKR